MGGAAPTPRPVQEHPAVTARRAAKTDRVIAAGRAATPDSAVDQRERPRLSISELNQMDANELRERYLDTPPDDERTPFQKVMDIVDLGRNTNANIAYGHPTVSGVVGAYPRGAGVGAIAGGIIGGLVGGVGGVIAGLPTGPGAIATGLAGAGAGAAEGAAIGGAGGLVTTAATQAAHGIIGLGVSKEQRDAITAGKEEATAGQPRIFTSDALNQLGVNNRIVNAVVGFGGDLVSDPDMWVGGSGWGAHAGELAIGPTARKTIQTSIKEASVGGVDAVKDEATRNLIREVAKRSPEMPLDAVNLGKALQGDVNKGVFPRVMQGLGGGEESTGGVFEKFLNKPKLEDNVADHGLIDATKDWITQHVATTPGLKFGTGEQQIAHLPFGGLGKIPEWNISIPGIMPSSKRTLDQFRWAADKAVYAEHPVFKDVLGEVRSVEAAYDKFGAYADDHATAHNVTMDAADAAPGGPNFVAPGVGGASRDELLTHAESMRNQYEQQVKQTTDEVEAATQRIRDKVQAYASDPKAIAEMASNPNTIFSLTELEDRAKKMQAVVNRKIELRKADSIAVADSIASAKEHVRTVQETYNRLVDLQTSVMKGGPAKSVTEIEHPLAASLRPDDEFVPPPELQGIGKRQYHRQVEGLLDQLKSMKKDNPHAANIHFELDLLRSRPSLVDKNSGYIGGGGAEKFGGRASLAMDPATGKLTINSDPLVQAKVFQAAKPILDAIDEARASIVKIQSGGKVAAGTTGDAAEDIQSARRPLFVPDEAPDPATQAKMAEHAAAIEGHRKSLHEITSPLRSGPQIDTEAWGESLHKHVMDQYDAAHQKLVDFHEHSPEAAEALVDAMGKHADALQAYRDMLGVPLANIMHRDGGAYMSMVKHAWGIDDDQVANSLLGTMGAAMAPLDGKPGAVYKAITALDRQTRPYFGARNGTQAAWMARIRSKDRNAEAIGAAFASEHLDLPLRRAVAELGLPATQMENAQILATMKLQQIHNARAVAAGRESAYALKYVVDGKQVDSALTPRANEMMNAIRSASNADPAVADKFFARIEESSRTALEMLDSIRDAELRDGILNQVLEDYVPHVPGPTTRATIRAARKSPGWEAKLPFSAEPKVTFQKRRMTAYYQFPDTRPGAAPDAVESFMESDRALLDDKTFPKVLLDEMEKTDPKRWRAIMDTRETIERYEELPNKPPPQTLDIASLNDVVRRGRFRMISGEHGMPYFEERLPLLTAARLAMHERAEVSQDLLGLVAQTGVNMDGKRFTEMAAKAAATQGQQYAEKLPSGETVTFRNVKSKFTGSDVNVADMRGQTWRMLDKEMFKHKDNPIITRLTKGMENTVLLEPVADFIEDIAKVWKDDKIRPALDVLDRVTGAIKTTQLLGPAWFVKSLVAHVTLFGQAGVNMASWAKKVPSSGQMIWAQGDAERLAKIKTTLRGQGENVEEMLKANETGNVIGQGANLFSDELRQQGAVERDSTLPSLLKQMPWYEGTKANWDFRLAQSLAANNPALRKAGYPLAAIGALRDTYNRGLVKPFFSAYQKVNDTVRLAAVRALVEDGNDVRSAIEKVRRGAYDYEDMTSFEHKYMRVMVPFYKWVRNNLAYQVKMLFEEPKWANAYPKLKNAFEEMTSGEQRVPDNMRPEWMQEELATQLGDNPDSRYALMLGKFSPQIEAVDVAQGLTGVRGLMDAAKFGLSQTNPIPQAAASLAYGKDLFSGRSIGAGEGEGDMTAGQFLAGQVRPLSEYGPGGKVQEAFGRGGLKGGALRLGLGGSAQEFDQARLETTKGRELRDTVENLRRAVTMQERRGDKQASLRSRAQLLRVYQKAMELGLEKQVQVPKWAKQSVKQFGGE